MRIVNGLVRVEVDDDRRIAERDSDDVVIGDDDDDEDVLAGVNDGRRIRRLTVRDHGSVPDIFRIRFERKQRGRNKQYRNIYICD